MVSKIELLQKHRRLLREALTQVKVDHLNKKVSLPLETHALMENTLVATTPSARKRQLRPRQVFPAFRFKRHRTPEALLRQFIRPSGWKLEDITFGDVTGRHDTGSTDMATGIRKEGFWGFTETRAKPPVIHFWHDGRRSEAALTMFFGHEMGHNLGEALEDEEEEYRADDYGRVAVLACKAARKACRGG